MAIRKGVTVFTGGSLRKVDLDEKGRIAGEPVQKQTAAAPASSAGAVPMKRNQVMAALKAAGIKFKATDKIEVMLELLNKGPEKPAEEKTDDAKSGTGDQDVI